MAEIALAHLIGLDMEPAYQRSDMLERQRGKKMSWTEIDCGNSKANNLVNPEMVV